MAAALKRITADSKKLQDRFNFLFPIYGNNIAVNEINTNCNLNSV